MRRGAHTRSAERIDLVLQAIRARVLALAPAALRPAAGARTAAVAAATATAPRAIVPAERPAGAAGTAGAAATAAAAPAVVVSAITLGACAPTSTTRIRRCRSSSTRHRARRRIVCVRNVCQLGR